MGIPTASGRATSRPCSYLAGDPLAGPSAVEAVAAGCVFISPQFTSAHEGYYRSQHPYLQSHVGPPYVCEYAEGDDEGALRCVDAALARTHDLAPVVPREMTEAAHRERVREIFGGPLQLQEPGGG